MPRWSMLPPRAYYGRHTEPNTTPCSCYPTHTRTPRHTPEPRRLSGRCYYESVTIAVRSIIQGEQKGERDRERHGRQDCQVQKISCDLPQTPLPIRTSWAWTNCNRTHSSTWHTLACMCSQTCMRTHGWSLKAATLAKASLAANTDQLLASHSVLEALKVSWLQQLVHCLGYLSHQTRTPPWSEPLHVNHAFCLSSEKG